MNQNLDWGQIKNWWPLLTSLVGITMFLSLIYYKVNSVDIAQKEFIAEFKLWRTSLETRVGQDKLDLAVIKDKLNIR